MTLEESKKTILAIEAINLDSDQAIPELEQIFVSQLKNLLLYNLVIHPHPEINLLRACKLPTLDSFFASIKRHSYNPNSNEIQLGRANYPEQQIFYIARNRATALAEVNIIQNEMHKTEVAYSLSRWEIKKTLNLISIFNPETINQLGSQELDYFKNYVISSYQKLKSDPFLEGTINFYNFISRKFTEYINQSNTNKYKITSAFANFIYMKFPEHSGIIYQSVKYPDLYNLALRKETIDRLDLYPTHFIKNKFIRQNIIELTEFDRVISEDFDIQSDKIEWNNHL